MKFLQYLSQSIVPDWFFSYQVPGSDQTFYKNKKTIITIVREELTHKVVGITVTSLKYKIYLCVFNLAIVTGIAVRT